jgi:hypothetical protein
MKTFIKELKYAAQVSCFIAIIVFAAALQSPFFNL